MTRTVALGPGREFDVIRELVRRWGPAARGIGDDAAIIDVPPGARLVASTDASVEDVHFRRPWLTAQEVGYRAAAAALSDLAAMAATPLAMLVAMSVPGGWRADVNGVADGIGEAAGAAGAPIVGGNTTGGEKLALTVTVLGHAPHPLGRDGVRVGDSLYVTGTLGGPGAALRAWESGSTPATEHRRRFARPVARIGEARWLAERGAHAAIDVSDGLAADLRHLAAASHVDIEVQLDAIPVVPGIRALDAIASGEEYEVVVAAAEPIDEHAFARAFGVPLTCIGKATAAGSQPALRARAMGRFVDLPSGHDHFSG